MLSAADTDLKEYLPVFAELGVSVAFLVPTETGYSKSIMDATAPVRELLKKSGLHDYELQGQGQTNKSIVDAYFVEHNDVIKTTASLYRPETKKGDPRIWFSGLTKHCEPWNLLALTIIDGAIYVFNLSDPFVSASLLKKGEAYSILSESARDSSLISEELLDKLREINKRGFLKSITEGDPGVGDTLENALGISRNNLQAPDYKGIELKSSRITRGGRKKQETRISLFGKVPDGGLRYSQLLKTYGKTQTTGDHCGRFQLECTLKSSKYNSYGLKLLVDANKDKLFIQDNQPLLASFWNLQTLRDCLQNKHRETFWIKAKSEYQDGIEYFKYESVEHTKNPNVSLFAPLIEEDIITLDLLAYLKENGTCRDHGALFKIYPENKHLLLGNSVVYDLSE